MQNNGSTRIGFLPCLLHIPMTRLLDTGEFLHTEMSFSASENIYCVNLLIHLQSLTWIIFRKKDSLIAKINKMNLVSTSIILYLSAFLHQQSFVEKRETFMSKRQCFVAFQVPSSFQFRLQNYEMKSLNELIERFH